MCHSHRQRIGREGRESKGEIILISHRGLITGISEITSLMVLD